eukprot:5094348-Lingulodinium_polyedra.AAC.1
MGQPRDAKTTLANNVARQGNARQTRSSQTRTSTKPGRIAQNPNWPQIVQSIMAGARWRHGTLAP